MNEMIKNTDYRSWISELKQQIRRSQIKAAIAVNSQLILLYLDMGRQIAEKQETAKWGSGFIEQLSKDLRAEFPEMTGLSKANLFRIRNFYLFYRNELLSQGKVAQVVRQISSTDTKIVTQLAAPLLIAETEQIVSQIPEQIVRKLISIPWGHHILIFEKIKDLTEALFYVHKTIENNWSRAVLEYQIETNLYKRQGKAVTNFTAALPEPQSDLANALLKDPYNFDFMQLTEKVKEIDIEKALVRHISHFLPELGTGFAYMGRQFLLRAGTKEYRTDLLFYHTRLKCYVVIELKAKEFEPEFIGKLNFYINVINELVRDDVDKPTIGMLLVKNKDNYEVEFALRDVNNPIGVSSYHYTELAEEIRAALPSEEELTLELTQFEQEMTNESKDYEAK